METFRCSSSEKLERIFRRVILLHLHDRLISNTASTLTPQIALGGSLVTSFGATERTISRGRSDYVNRHEYLARFDQSTGHE